jgi:hypothetical protein
MNKHEKIMEVLLDILDTSAEEENCANASTAVDTVCDDQYQGEYLEMFQYILENMTEKEFKRIKDL